MPRFLLEAFNVELDLDLGAVVLSLRGSDEVDASGTIQIDLDPPPPNSYIFQDLEGGKNLARQLQEAIQTLESLSS